MDAGAPGNAPGGANDGDGGGRQPAKNVTNGPLDVFGDTTELPFLVILFLFAMLVEYFRSISPCTC